MRYLLLCATRFRVWQRKSHDLNIWTARKLEEKLNYLHDHPAAGVSAPGQRGGKTASPQSVTNNWRY
jgi:hypothetical protein